MTRKSGIFVLIALSFILTGTYAWWAAAARGLERHIEPVLLSFGAAFAALGLNDDLSDGIQLFDSKKWFENSKPKFDKNKKKPFKEGRGRHRGGKDRRKIE